MPSLRLTALLLALTAAFASQAHAGSGLGTISVQQVTDTTITIAWTNPPGNYPLAPGVPFKVCWKKHWSIQGICQGVGEPVFTNSSPHTISGLQPNRKYKIRVEANTYKIKNNNTQKGPRFREIGTIFVTTKSGPAPTPMDPPPHTGTIYATTVGSLPGIGTDTEVTVEWSHPTDFDYVRIAYERYATYKWDELFDVCSERNWVDVSGQPFIVNHGPVFRWGSSNGYRGWFDIDPFDSSPVTHAFPELTPCTEYRFVAFGFRDGDNLGKYLGETQATHYPTLCSAQWNLGDYVLSGATYAFEEYGEAVADHYAGMTAPTFDANLVASATAVDGEGEVGLVTAGASGMTWLNVMEPAVLTVESSWTLGAAPISMAAHADLAAVLDTSGLVSIIDKGSRSAVAQIPVDAGASSVALDASRLYVANGSSGLHIIDLDDLESTDLPTSGVAQAVAVSDLFAYVANDNGSVDAYFIKVGPPFKFSTLSNVGAGLDCAIKGDMIYIAAGADGVHTLTHSGGLFPLESVAQYDTPGFASSLDLVGDDLFVTDGAGQVLVFDTTSPAPTLIASYDLGGDAFDVAALPNGHLAVAAGGGPVKVYDAQSAAVELAHVGTYTTDAASFLRFLAMSDSELAAAIEGRIAEGEDLSDPTYALRALLNDDESDAYDVLQSEPSLVLAGLDLESYLAATDPDLLAEMLDDLNAAWDILGPGLAGQNGVPSLTGEGPLLGGDPMAVHLSGARPNSLSYLILGFSPLEAPFMAGTLVPAPDVIISGVLTNSEGEKTIATTWPAGIPSMFQLYYQYWIIDDAAPFGLSASNGLELTTP